jgi:hypothetical protein
MNSFSLKPMLSVYSTLNKKLYWYGFLEFWDISFITKFSQMSWDLLEVSQDLSNHIGETFWHLQWANMINTLRTYNITFEINETIFFPSFHDSMVYQHCNLVRNMYFIITDLWERILTIHLSPVKNLFEIWRQYLFLAILTIVHFEKYS